MKILALSLLLIGCSHQSECTLPPNQKFVDGEVVFGKLRIKTRPSVREQPEITLFNDGQGGEFTIYEQ